MERVTQMPYASLLSIWLGLTVSFAAAYFALETYFPQHGPEGLEGESPLFLFLDCLYYSIITATSTGYGDIVPIGFSKVLASIQSLSSIFIFAVFIAKLMSHQQEAMLTEVHRLTFEDVFHNNREGLFLARKDLDTVIREVEKTGSLSEEGWQNFLNASRQIQAMVQEIPEFYASDSHRYSIDQTREQLLLEAVHRTLHRVNATIDAMAERGINWAKREETMQELQKLVSVVSQVTPSWQERSPHKATEAFEDILRLNMVVHGKIQRAVGPNTLEQ